MQNLQEVKWSRSRPGAAQRVGRGIALLFHDRSTRRSFLVSSTPRPHFTPGKEPVPTVQEAGVPQDQSGRTENIVLNFLFIVFISAYAGVTVNPDDVYGNL